MLLGWIPSNISVGIPLYYFHSYLKSAFSQQWMIQNIISPMY